MTADARGFIGCDRHGTVYNHKELALDQNSASTNRIEKKLLNLGQEIVQNHNTEHFNCNLKLK